MSFRLLRIVSAAAILVAAASGVRASGNARPLTLRDYHHTGWTVTDGAPANVHTMAQTRDGYLWLGTPTGLYRFDGMVFKRHETMPTGSTRTRSVAMVIATPDDSLLVAYVGGELNIVPPDRREGCCLTDGIPAEDALNSLVNLARGDVWALTQGAVYALYGRHWRKVDLRPMGIDSDTLDDIGTAADGAVFADTGHGLYRRDVGATRFVPMAGNGMQPDRMTAGVDGIVRMLAPGRAWKRIYPETAATPLVTVSGLNRESSGTLFDSRGNFWRGALGAAVQMTSAQQDPWALYPITVDPKAATMDTADGMTDHFAMIFFEDREGDVWVGTKGGIDRFRPQALAEVTFPEPVIYFALVPAVDGSMFVGSASVGLKDRGWEIRGNSVKQIVPDMTTTVAYRDDDGSILAGSERGLFRLADGSIREAIPVPARDRDIKIQALARDGSGGLWVSFRGNPVERWHDGTWTPKGGLALPDMAPARMVRDASGRVWMGYQANRLDIVDGDRLTTFTEAQGIALASVTAILPGTPTLLGGERGLAVLSQGVVRPVRTSRPDAVAGITGLLRRGDGSLWVNGFAGAVFIAPAEVRALEKDPDHVVQVRVFGPADGMPGTAQQVRPLPTLVEDAGGKLWFAASSGLATLDPAHVPPVVPAPRVVIDTVTTQGSTLVASEKLSLPSGTRGVRIAYSAPTLAYPERLTYRYRLVGLDSDWQDVGQRREASYTNLAGGRYRFLVEAANENGEWSGQPSGLDIVIAPSFRETRWFWVACGLVLLAVVELLYIVRMNVAARARERRRQVRAMERERVARTLHDTLLQGLQGLLLRLQAGTSDPGATDAHRRELGEAADIARGILIEGRSRIMDLRSGDTSPSTLRDVLATACSAATSHGRVSARFIEEGVVRPVIADVAHEIAAIVAEAVFNAVRHAGTPDIEVRTMYRRRTLIVDVRDGGVGLDAETLHAGGKAGHWGLTGMRERAERLGGTLTIVSAPDRGTKVTLKVRGAVAYSPSVSRGQGSDA